MKTKLFITLIIIFPILFSSSMAQTYNKMRITLDEGTTINGKKGALTDASVSCQVNGQLQTYDLSEVTLVTAKKGSAIKWAAGMGGCCIAIFAVSGAVDPEGQLEPEGMMGAYILGSAMLTVAGAGLGYLIGALTDPWKNIYLANRPLAMNRFAPILSFDHMGHPLFGFSYRL